MNESESFLGNTQNWDRFREFETLSSHWNRPPGPRSLYWYLTFEQSSDLHTLVRRYQQAISFPYYDSVPILDLHMTLDRAAFEERIDRHVLNEIKAAALSACRGIPPLRISVGSVSGTRGAIGFEIFEDSPIRDLRDRLSGATKFAYPRAPVRGPYFHAHIAIAYCNCDGVPVRETVDAVESLGPVEPLSIDVREASLVSLERHTRSYEWNTVFRIPLSG